ncbi:MAG: glycosyltransferase, partial [Sediminibacterium sp.]|nr:glycosyltransferase [Sediminibacterium sp.]
LQIPTILFSIWYEHQWLKNMQKKHAFDFIISDNRYGLYNAQCKNFIITHQLTIQMPFNWLEIFIQKIHYFYIQKFNVCLIPDCENIFNNLAGKLSHPHFLPKIETKYINILTRFCLPKILPIIKYDYCFLLSGTEPQRTILENIIFNQIKDSNKKIVFIRGVTNNSSLQFKSNTIAVFNFLDSNALLNIILQSNFIIARSGYTTVMELAALQKKVLYIPTPQQTEQLYLASYLQNNNLGVSLNQHAFNFKIAQNKLHSFSPNFNKIKTLQEIDLLPLLK